MLCVGKYNYKTKTYPILKGFHTIVIHTTGPLSPYVMKDSQGRIMENIWQFSKIWETVDQISQPISQYMSDKIRWQHTKETHFNGIITPSYWKWRNKGMYHDKWVRYPNGFKNHKNVIGTVTEDGEIIDKFQARLEIYYKTYCEIAMTTKLYKDLQKMWDEGTNILIIEVDGPTYSDEYPYNQTVDGVLMISPEVLDALILGNQAFGHGYSLAGLLLGWKL